MDVEVVGRLAPVELVGGRVGGLLRPPPVVPAREAELTVGFGPVEPAMTGRRTAPAEVAEARLVVVELPAGSFPSTADLDPLAGAEDSAAGASSCWTTSKPSASDMMVLWGALCKTRRFGAEALTEPSLRDEDKSQQRKFPDDPRSM